METFWAHDAVHGVVVLVHSDSCELVAGHAGVLGAGCSGHGDDPELVAGEDHELTAGHAGGLKGNMHQSDDVG